MMTLIRTRSKDTNAVSSMRKVFARLRKWRSMRMLFPFLSEKGGMRIHMNSCEYLSVALNRGSVQSTSIVETPSGGSGVTFLIPDAPPKDVVGGRPSLSFVQAQHYLVALESRAIGKLNHKSETVRIRLRGLDSRPGPSGEQTANMLRFCTWFFERARLRSEIFETLSTP